MPSHYPSAPVADVRADALAKVPLFQGLSGRDLKALTKQLREDRFKAGQVIVEEGDTSGRLYVILEGTAKVNVGGRNRHRMGPGSFIGELSILDKGERTATVTAESEVLAVSLSSTTFMTLLSDNWTATRTVLGTMARRIRSLDKQITD